MANKEPELSSSELIKYLNKLPKTMPIWVRGPDGNWLSVNNVLYSPVENGIYLDTDKELATGCGDC